ASGNRRNFKLLGVLALLIAGNAVFHVEVMKDGIADHGLRFGLAVVIVLIVVIGGRVVPNFTLHAPMRPQRGRGPRPFASIATAPRSRSPVRRLPPGSCCRSQARPVRSLSSPLPSSRFVLLAGPAIARAATGSCSSCTSLMPSCPWASC